MELVHHFFFRVCKEIERKLQSEIEVIDMLPPWIRILKILESFCSILNDCAPTNLQKRCYVPVLFLKS